MGSFEPYIAPVTITTTPPLWTGSEVNTTGLLCLLCEVSSLAYGARSTVKYSFALPYAVPKYDALLTCFSTPRMQLQAGDVAVDRVLVAESDGIERELSADLLPTVDTLTIPDALSNDPFFATSYRRERYDDFTRAGEGLEHLVSWNGLENGEGDIEYTRSRADNCVMLTGEWYASRRHTVELTYLNPRRDPSAAQTDEITVWIAPLTGETTLLGGDEDWANEVSWSYAIRGHKYGTVCSADSSSDTVLRTSASSFSSTDAETQVQAFAFSDASNTQKRTNAGLRALAEDLCDKYSAEKVKLEAGTMSDQLVPGAMWRAFRLDSTALVDWQLIHDTNVSLYPRALDGRRPGVPTREHGIGSRCATLKGACDRNSGRLIDVRTTGARRKEDNIPKAEVILGLLGHAGGTFDPSLADRRYRSLYTFGLIGEVLRSSAARYECTGLLLDGTQDGTTFYLGNERGGVWPGDVSEL